MRWGLIALNGSVSSYETLKNQLSHYVGLENIELTIGVDGGCRILENLDVSPDMMLGDFDSIGSIEHYGKLWPNADIIKFSAEKDNTDAELAFDEMSLRKLDKVAVIGALGGRADHMLSVVQLIGREKNFILLDELNYIEKIEAPYYKVVNKNEIACDYVSIMPLYDVLSGITLKGFKYPLDDATIKVSQTLGISNEIVDDEAIIEIKTGSGLLIFSKDRN